MLVGSVLTIAGIGIAWGYLARPGTSSSGTLAHSTAPDRRSSGSLARSADAARQSAAPEAERVASATPSDPGLAGRFTWPGGAAGNKGALVAAEPRSGDEHDASAAERETEPSMEEAPRVTPVAAVPGDEVAAAAARFERGERVAARDELNELLKKSPAGADARRAREQLARFADEMIFSPKRIADDRLIVDYAIRAGDRLAKVGRAHKVPYGVIMRINNIRDAARIRENQRIKVPNGPFHARIVKSEFRIDLYLQDVYVRSYRVGLGAEPGTPEGVWRVKEILVNPTFFPPASYPDKRIIAADDPKNPLGEHWIGLEGVEGAAVGHEGYGLHGTIEPDSIGRAVSHGCIRMLNDDVAFVADLLAPGESTVTVLP